ncbi:MAG: FKBP-type peptidyl-prolyl cis-trans isomerase N-terminal domain-containing protein [Parachlamydiales bacterium]|nr:FKBP-type peptidyl-prolyl cis-trans isomerase N-terminal domain-containing protein [Parachlamydiales bacterium]
MLKALFISIPLLLGAAEDELDVAKISEAIGHMIGKNLEDLGLDFDLDAIVKGLREEAEGIHSPMNEDECVQAIAVLQEEKMETQAEQDLEKADAISNGDIIQDNEDHPFPAADSAKHR